MVVRPDLVEQGRVVELRIELPRIDPGSEPVGLELAGAGIEVLATRKLDVPDSESHWSARIRVTAPVGRAPFVLRPVYPDGGSVEYRQALTVVPADERSFPWAAVAAGAVAAVAAAAGALLLARRRGA